MRKLLIASLLLCLILPSASSAEEGLAKVCIEPPESTVRIGKHFTVALMIYDVEDMGGFCADLLYVPSVVTVESVELGDFIKNNYERYWSIGLVIDNEAGLARFGAMGAPREFPEPDSSGELALITFVAQGEGQSLLALQTAVIWGILTADTPVLPSYTENARVTVELYHIYLPLVSQQSPTT